MMIPKPVIYILAVIGLAYVLLQTFFTFGPIRHCESDGLRVAISPSKQHIAKLEVEKCDDKPEPIIQLNISNSSNTNQVKSVTIGIATTTDLDLTWLSWNKLQVTYPPSFQLTQQPSEIDGIEIIFIAKPISNQSFNPDWRDKAAPAG